MRPDRAGPGSLSCPTTPARSRAAGGVQWQLHPWTLGISLGMGTGQDQVRPMAGQSDGCGVAGTGAQLGIEQRSLRLKASPKEGEGSPSEAS